MMDVLKRKAAALLFVLALTAFAAFPAISQETAAGPGNPAAGPGETAGGEPEATEAVEPKPEDLAKWPPVTEPPGEPDVEIDMLTTEEEEFAGEEEEGLVKIGEDLYVPEDEEVAGDAVCIDGDLTVAGTVEGDAVCVGGDITLKGTAVVEGDVVSIGGSIDKDPGADINGQEINVGGKFAPIIPFISKFAELSEPIAGNVIDIVWEAALFLFLMFLGLLASVFMKRQLDNVHDHLTNEFPRSALLGIALAVLAPIALGVLAVSVIGWPLIPLLVVVMFALLYFGYVVFSQTLGGVILGAGKHPILKILVGVAILQSVAIVGDLISLPAGIFEEIGDVFGFIGTIIFLTCGVLGAGSILYSRLGLWPLEKTRERQTGLKGNNKAVTEAKER